MSTIFVILIYSSGMPILYFVGTMWFAATYLCNKLLIIYFYQSITTFNRIIPQFSVKFLKAALVCHMIGASFMLTNPESFETFNKQEDAIIAFNAVRDIEVIKDFYETYKDGAISGMFMNRIKFLHQQIFIIFLVIFVIVYLIGSGIYAVLNLIY